MHWKPWENNLVIRYDGQHMIANFRAYCINNIFNVISAPKAFRALKKPRHKALAK